mgnify:CR=1 FL=1
MKKFNLIRSFLLTLFLTNIGIFPPKIFAESNYSETILDIQDLTKTKDQDFIDQDFIDQDLYILGPGDQVKILEKSTNIELQTLTILNDGSLTFPMANNIKISGMTLKEAKTSLNNILSEELINPDLEIMLVNPRKIRFTVIGQVNSPGFYTQKKDEFSSKVMTVVDAIQIAGGITSEANLRDVSITRKLPNSSEINRKRAKLNLAKLIQFGETEQNPFVFDGDVIEVRKVKKNSNQEITKSNLSPEFIKIHVIGEVENPGEITVRSNTSLSKAILSAGGFKNNRYSSNNIELVRISENGNLYREKYKVDFTKKISKQLNPTLNQGDVVRVRRNILASATDSINTITGPFTGILNGIYIFKLLDE